MKKKILLFIIRLVRLFKAEDKFTPNLRSVPEGQVRTGQLYRYYGRILVSRPWQESVVTYSELDGDNWKPCSNIRYNEVRRAKGDSHVNLEAKNTACEKCALHKLSLPCRCDFSGGSFTGYYDLVHQDTQYCNNPTL